MTDAYRQGFMDKMAEHGVDPHQLVKAAAPLVGPRLASGFGALKTGLKGMVGGLKGKKNKKMLEQQVAAKIDEIARARMIPSTPIMMRQLYPEEWAQIYREREWLRKQVSKMTKKEKLEFVQSRV